MIFSRSTCTSDAAPAWLASQISELTVTHRWCASYLTGWFRNSLAWLLGKLYKDEVFPGTMRAACEKPVVEYHRWVRQRDEFVRMFYREVRVLSPRSSILPV